jgi:hypothetical protein
MGGYCASPPDDAGSTGECDPGDFVIGKPGMCGDGKTFPNANCCSVPDGGIDTDAQDDAPDDAQDSAPPQDARAG